MVDEASGDMRGTCDARRQLARKLGQMLSATPWRATRYRRIVEDHGDHRKPRDRFGTDSLRRRNAAHRLFDRLRHQDLHLFGREPRSLGLDRDLGRHELRQHVEATLGRE